MPPKRPERQSSGSLASQQLGGRGVEDAGSPAAWLVLALVIEQPSHGYEISHRYQRRFGELFPLSVPRVYGALDRLRDGGMIAPIELESEPARKQHLMRRSYRATRSGVRAYKRWVAERMRDDPRRPQLLGRIVSAGLLGVDAVLDVIDNYQRECMEELRGLPAGGPHSESPDTNFDELTESLVIDQQRRELRARHDWAVHAREMLEAYKKTSAAPQQRGSGERGSRAGAKP